MGPLRRVFDRFESFIGMFRFQLLNAVRVEKLFEFAFVQFG